MSILDDIPGVLGLVLAGAGFVAGGATAWAGMRSKVAALEKRLDERVVDLDGRHSGLAKEAREGIALLKAIDASQDNRLAVIEINRAHDVERVDRIGVSLDRLERTVSETRDLVRDLAATTARHRGEP